MLKEMSSITIQPC